MDRDWEIDRERKIEELTVLSQLPNVRREVGREGSQVMAVLWQGGVRMDKLFTSDCKHTVQATWGSRNVDTLGKHRHAGLGRGIWEEGETEGKKQDDDVSEEES